MSIKSKTDELCSAIEIGDYKICLELMADRSIINLRNFEQVRPLEKAAKYGETDICIALLERGANIEALDKSGWSPLCLAAGMGHKETCIALLDRGAKLNRGTSVDEVPVYAAASGGYIEVCLELLDRGAQIRNDLLENLWKLGRPKSYGHDISNFDKCLLAFVAYGAEIPNYYNSDETPLEAASLIGNEYLLNKMLYSDSNKESLPNRVYKACQIAHDQEVKESEEILSSWIYHHKTYVALNEKDNENKEEKIDEFMAAINAGNIAEVEKMISEGFDIDSICSDGREEKPLLCFAAKKDNNRVLLELIRQGANIEAKSASGRTALFYACSDKGLDNLSTLLDHGANMDAVDNDGNTPLIQASSVTLKDECLLLIERGANLDIKNNKRKSALSSAIIRTNSGFEEINNYAKDICLALIANGASTTDNTVAVPYGNKDTRQTLLEYAALKEHGILLTKLLEADSDPKTLPVRAAQALQIAIEGDKQESVAILSSWSSRQAAIAAIAEFAEPTIERTSQQELAARSVQISMANVISDCRTDSQDAAEVQVNNKERKVGRKMV